MYVPVLGWLSGYKGWQRGPSRHLERPPCCVYCMHSWPQTKDSRYCMGAPLGALAQPG